MTQRAAILTAALALAAASALVVLAGAVAQAPTPGTGTIGRLAVDVVTAGNTATSLGPTDGCVRMEVGTEIEVDVILDAIPASRPIVAFQYAVKYDPQLLEVTAFDAAYLLAATGTYEPFVGFQDTFPDTDGLVGISILDLASNAQPGANMESGAGVLTRLTFRAKAAGQSLVIPQWSGLEDEYPQILDNFNQPIQIDQFVGGTISVGQDCVPGTTPVATALPTLPAFAETPTPTIAPGATTPPAGESPGASGSPGVSGSPGGSPGTSGRPSGTPEVEEEDGDDGTSAGLIAVAAILGVLGVGATGAGAWFLIQRRRAGGQAEGE